MSNVFNTTFESSLRVLLILNVAEHKLSSDKITAIDFISVYGKDFGVSKDNLHGNNSYRFSEITSKRKMINAAIKELVLLRFVKASSNKSGFVYSITTEGKEFCEKLNDDYAESFVCILEKTFMKYNSYSDRKLARLINEYAVATFGGK